MYRYISSFTQNHLIIKVFLKDLKDVPKLATSKFNLEHINSLKDIQQLSDECQFNSSLTIIKREFEFPYFQGELRFMSSVSDISEKMEHYPKQTNQSTTLLKSWNKNYSRFEEEVASQLQRNVNQF